MSSKTKADNRFERAIAYGVPALILSSGIIILLIGYPTNFLNIVSFGWQLVTLGSLIYASEIVLLYNRKSKHNSSWQP